MSETIRDPVERIVAEALSKASIAFVRECVSSHWLDFYLPDLDLYIEVCAYHTPRKIEQMSRVQNGILIQGKRAAEEFARLIDQTQKDPAPLIQGAGSLGA